MTETAVEHLQLMTGDGVAPQADLAVTDAAHSRHGCADARPHASPQPVLRPGRG
ncbi:hypothetical protein [Ilumatobacter sp.]|uniref:hypothetical protein n=1 Tax=Ilumatobacter sp. TaxID=1967498 RepID=UPI003752700F